MDQNKLLRNRTDLPMGIGDQTNLIKSYEYDMLLNFGAVYKFSSNILYIHCENVFIVSLK